MITSFDSFLFGEGSVSGVCETVLLSAVRVG